ncbi:hypothetical protein PV433_30845 [Paenibacillus sp. GYB004]|uniref:hypothetical protein n=1 Tax=Paenibacillus sp. GYB004 TaxID=2994393 RepID=UPI002F96CBDC
MERPTESDEIVTLTRMREMLQQYVPVIRRWTTPDGRLPDPFETVYSENYAPANAAAVLASVCSTRSSQETSDSLSIMLERTMQLLGDKQGVNPFCRVFLYHYGLMALLLAPEADRSRLIGRFGPDLAAYEDDCAVVNTNCAALQWAMELFTGALGLRAVDHALLSHRLKFIANAQLESGFINDEVNETHSHDGMPIAYHAFTLFLLTGAIAVIERWPDEWLVSHREAESIIRRGMDWLRHAITPDGSFAMVERSSYQTFTWGALVALLAYCSGESGNEYGAAARDAFRSWLPYAHEDGTYGSTPNVLPHSLRVGYESYTHLNMYNLLGLTGIAVAVRLLERGVRLPAGDNPAATGDSHGHEGHEDEAVVLAGLQAGAESFVDKHSGYAFYRGGPGSANFFGCTLRMHNRKYAPAMQGFHFRLAGQRLPLAEPRLPEYQEVSDRTLRDGVWEGFAVTDDNGVLHIPAITGNVEVRPSDNGFTMTLETGLLRCEKTIAISDSGIEWSYALTALQPLRSCQHVVPLLVHDGRNALEIASQGGGLRLRFAGRMYLLECPEAVSLDMNLYRSLLSVSGVSAQARAVVAGPLQAGDTVRWTTSLRPVTS